MGNRAVITTKENFDNNGVGVYLHWNGGRDSIEAFLKYMKLKGHRAPDRDCYGWARLCQVIGNYFGGTTSIGINKMNRLDANNGDNGTYIIKGWDIVGRKYFKGVEQNYYNIDEMLICIDESQPLKDQLGKEFLTAKEVETSEIKVGDKVYVLDYPEKYELYEVLGFGNGVVDGIEVTGVPYVNICKPDCHNYIRNYLREDTYRIGVVK